MVSASGGSICREVIAVRVQRIRWLPQTLPGQEISFLSYDQPVKRSHSHTSSRIGSPAPARFSRP